MSKRHHQDIATALVDSAIEANNVLQIVRDIEVIEQLFLESASFIQDLSEVSVPLQLRKNALEKAIENKVHTFVLNTVLILMSKQLLTDFGLFCDTVRALVAEKANHHEVEVTSAIELDENEKVIISKKLEKMWNGTVTLKVKVDASILGGLQFQSGTWVHDATLKGKIQQLQKTLTTTT
ncbi:ATP synthase F1 subunit delta [Candidatus Uhrbacteria bacterium]|nr:ATP synthase F1 subunit delta [Candidatus Uhrbacteria bacterium]